jgi:sialate O-acetylesterase
MKRISSSSAAVFCLVTAWSASALHAEVKLSKCFTPHMVLQRGMEVPVWGTAAPSEKVSVAFAGQTVSATADDKGAWRVKLAPLTASAEPKVMTVGERKIEDVLVGDVWVGSGQSNMDMLAGSYTAGDPVLADAVKQTFPKMRLMGKNAGSVWELAVPGVNEKFSALLFSFGYALQKEVDVPIGLMVGAVGGTPSGFWLSEEMYRSDAACAEVVKKFEATYNYDEALAKHNVAKAKYDADFAAWKTLAEEAKKEGKPAPGAPRAPQIPINLNPAMRGADVAQRRRDAKRCALVHTHPVGECLLVGICFFFAPLRDIPSPDLGSSRVRRTAARGSRSRMARRSRAS